MIEEKQNKSSDERYLERLTFNPELRKSWLNFFVTNPRVILLLIGVLSVIGIFSFTELPRESSPEVKIPIAVVVTVYPGASPADVEELITERIETELANLENVESINSSSANSVSSVTVEFSAKADLDESLRSLRDAVSDVAPKLPDEANDPEVIQISLDDTPIWTASLTSPVDGIELRKAAERVQDELEQIQGIREVRISGGDETEFEVAYDPMKIIGYQISIDQANQLIRASNLAIPSGSFDGESYTYPIRVDGRLWTAESIAAIPLLTTPDGSLVTVGDIATVREIVRESAILSRFANANGTPERSVTIQIIKKTGGSIVKTVDEAEKRIDAILPTLPQGSAVHVVNDMSEMIQEDFNRLTHDFLLTIILVFAILFLIVGLKEAFVAGLAVPLVFFATFGIMYINGISLNFLSMFSLILSLGLLVDDAIVVVSATKQYLTSGKFTPEEAVLLVLNDFKIVLTTTTLTTVWAFLPLLMATGIIGEYIKSIPITVSATLIASLIIALIINHPLAAVLERIRLTPGFFWFIIVVLIGGASAAAATGTTAGIIAAIIFGLICIALFFWFVRGGKRLLSNNAELVLRETEDDELIKAKLRSQGNREHGSFWSRLMHGIIHFNAILPVYERVLRSVIRTRMTRLVALGAIGALFVAALALPLTGVVKTEFFPNADFDFLSINIEAPTGLRLEETDAIVRSVESTLLAYDEIQSISTIVGVRASMNDFSVSGATPSHTASITVRLVPRDQRGYESYEFAEILRGAFAPITEANISVESPEAGPPSGADIDAQISGEDLRILSSIANDLEPMLKAVQGVIDTDISLRSAPADYTFTILSERASYYGVNAASIGSTFRTAISGSEITTMLRNGDETSIVARFEKDRIPTLEDLQNLQILNVRNEPIFLKDVATVELKPGVESITRVDRKRSISLTGVVDSSTRPEDALASFQQSIDTYELPEGYAITFGGQNETNEESVLSIIRAMIIAALLIIATLIIQFNSLRQSMIVIVTIPLAMTGVMFGLALTGIRLSFPGLIGLVALFGIVVKNAIILMDKINLNRRFGIPFIDAVVDAGKSRLEAIFITSISTIVGIIPITLSDATWRALGGAIISGLALSSFFTLFVIPTLYVSLHQREKRREDDRLRAQPPAQPYEYPETA